MQRFCEGREKVLPAGKRAAMKSSSGDLNSNLLNDDENCAKTDYGTQRTAGTIDLRGLLVGSGGGHLRGADSPRSRQRPTVADDPFDQYLVRLLRFLQFQRRWRQFETGAG